MIEAKVESSKSRTGKHAFRALVLVVDGKGNVKEPKIIKSEAAKPLYVVGKAQKVYITLKDDEYAVLIMFLRNLRGEVKGKIIVVDSSGRELLRAKYVKGLVRRSFGKPEYGWIIQRVLDHLKIPYRRINLRTGS